MITINKGATNSIYLTLIEKTTLENAVYLFSFKNDFTHQQKHFLCPTSTIDIYTVAEIEETETEDLLTGRVELSPTGFWTYVIREQESTTNLDPDQSGDIVETGKVQVIGTASVNYTYQNENTTNNVYTNRTGSIN